MRLFLIAAVVAAAGGAASAAAGPGTEEARDRHLTQFVRDVGQQPRAALYGATGWLLEREAVMRLISILSGTRPSGDKSNGWLVPSRTRYTFAWLAQRLDRDGDGTITAMEFDGPSAAFKVLDRDRDGALTALDLDWSEKAPLAKAGLSAKMLFRAIDADGDGQVTPQEWDAYREQLSQGKPYLAQDDLLSLFLTAGKRPGDKGPGGRGKDPRSGEGGINVALLRAFFDGDVGSWFEGPRPGARAPDFTLPTHDGKGSLMLSDFAGKRPVVLIFGSFT